MWRKRKWLKRAKLFLPPDNNISAQVAVLSSRFFALLTSLLTENDAICQSMIAANFADWQWRHFSLRYLFGIANEAGHLIKPANTFRLPRSANFGACTSKTAINVKSWRSVAKRIECFLGISLFLDGPFLGPKRPFLKNQKSPKKGHF